VNKAAAFWLHACSSQLRKHKKIQIVYLKSRHNSIFGYKLRTIEQPASTENFLVLVKKRT